MRSSMRTAAIRFQKLAGDECKIIVTVLKPYNCYLAKGSKDHATGIGLVSGLHQIDGLVRVLMRSGSLCWDKS